MNKEQQELLDESYKNFEKWYNEHSGKEDYTGYFVPDKEEFIRLIKTDDLFSEKWGLKIGERELGLEERYDIHKEYITEDKLDLLFEFATNENLDKLGVPTKAIRVTHNGQTIESYE